MYICQGAGQVSEANTSDDTWCTACAQEVSVAQVSVRVDDHDWCRYVHVQTVKSTNDTGVVIVCVRLG